MGTCRTPEARSGVTVVTGGGQQEWCLILRLDVQFRRSCLTKADVTRVTPTAALTEVVLEQSAQEMRG
jgi:hypothetical protein